MELSFNSRRIREICENTDLAQEFYGQQLADNLRKRLADIDAVLFISDLPVENLITAHKNETVKISLTPNANLIFCANHVNNPRFKNGKIDWEKVSRIKILKIEIHE